MEIFKKLEEEGKKIIFIKNLKSKKYNSEILEKNVKLINKIEKKLGNIQSNEELKKEIEKNKIFKLNEKIKFIIYEIEYELKDKKIVTNTI